MLFTVEFDAFLNGAEDQRKKAAASLVQSFQKTGFVKLVKHGISIEIIQAANKWNEKFFSLKPDQKMTVVNHPSPQPQRGWSYKGAETTAGLRPTEGLPATDRMDEKEHFDMGPPTDKEYPNKWAENKCSGFQAFSEMFYEKCQTLCLQVMAACEIGCDLPPGTLLNLCQPASSELRYNYYPPVSLKKLDEGKTRRGWPHTDFGIITLLFQDDQGGLEYEDRSQPGTFIPLIREAPDEIAINVSDTFQRLSNDFFLAGVHQVWIPRDISAEERSFEDCVLPERRSNVFFFKAHKQSMVGSLPQFVNEKRPAKYDNITALNFQKKMTQILIMNTGHVPL